MVNFALVGHVKQRLAERDEKNLRNENTGTEYTAQKDRYYTDTPEHISIF